MKDTKDLILETAYELFILNNYEAVTFREICNATKLTKGAVYHYFQSKEDLFKAVVEKYLIHDGQDIIVGQPSLLEMIHFSLGRLKARTNKYKSNHSGKSKIIPRQFMALIMAAYRYYPNFEKVGNKILKAQIEQWQKVVENAIKCKEIRSDIDPKTVALLFFTTLTNVFLGLVHDSSLDSLEIVGKQLDQIYRLLKI